MKKLLLLSLMSLFLLTAFASAYDNWYHPNTLNDYPSFYQKTVTKDYNFQQTRIVSSDPWSSKTQVITQTYNPYPYSYRYNDCAYSSWCHRTAPIYNDDRYWSSYHDSYYSPVRYNGDYYDHRYNSNCGRYGWC